MTTRKLLALLIKMCGSVFLTTAGYCIDGVPHTILVDAQGKKPMVALFNDSEGKDAFTVDQGFAKLWWPAAGAESVRAKVVVALFRGEYENNLAGYRIRADLNRQSNIKAVQVKGEPGCLIVTWRDGTKIKHYINSTPFVSAAGCRRLEPITTEELQRETGGRSPKRSFRFYRSNPPPTPKPERKRDPANPFCWIGLDFKRGDGIYVTGKNIHPSETIMFDFRITADNFSKNVEGMVLKPGENKTIYSERSTTYGPMKTKLIRARFASGSEYIWSTECK